jgi:hypothetical protein
MPRPSDAPHIETPPSACPDILFLVYAFTPPSAIDHKADMSCAKGMW